MVKMTEEEKFTFDLQGFLILRGVLSHSECEELSSIADHVMPSNDTDELVRRKGQISLWHEKYLNLIDHPKVLPYLLELLGPRVRLDHDYCFFMKKGGSSTRLHGGPKLVESNFWYHYQDGVMRNGMTVVTWALTDAEQGEGGFACIPGSHKSNFLRSLPLDIALYERQVEYVQQPTIQAGDVLIFTEALIHGTQQWTADHERRALLFKYSPPHASWALKPYNVIDYPKATEQQRRLLAPPSVEEHPLVPVK